MKKRLILKMYKNLLLNKNLSPLDRITISIFLKISNSFWNYKKHKSVLSFIYFLNTKYKKNHKTLNKYNFYKKWSLQTQ